MRAERPDGHSYKSCAGDGRGRQVSKYIDADDNDDDDDSQLVNSSKPSFIIIGQDLSKQHCAQNSSS